MSEQPETGSKRVSRERWHPPAYEKQDIWALQALEAYAREAVAPSLPENAPPVPTPQECKRALDWIIEVAAGTYDEPFEAGRPDVRDYLLGRRSVGLAIVKLIKIRVGKVFHGQQTSYDENG